MKQLKCIFLLFLLPLLASADHVHWLGDYDKALQLDGEEIKNNMLENILSYTHL